MNELLFPSKRSQRFTQNGIMGHLEKFDKVPIPEEVITYPYEEVELLLLGLRAPEGSLQQNPYIGQAESFEIQPCERRPVQYAATQVAYEGPWYYQAYNPTCTAWAIANAGLRIGRPPDMDTIMNLSMLAKIKKDGKLGLNLDVAAQFVNLQAEMPYRLAALERNTKNMHYSATSGLDSPRTVASYRSSQPGDYSTLTEWANEVGVYDPYNQPQITSLSQDLTDAAITHLDAGGSIVTIVNAASYFGRNRKGTHAICLSGYRINEDGFLDFQVIDSARGIHWVPHERIGIDSMAIGRPIYKTELKTQR